MTTESAGGGRGPIQGPSDRPEDLAARIEAKVAARVLPRDRPEKMWVGPGSGKICDGCDRAITNGHQEYEFDPPGWPTIRLHQDCLQFWHAARMKTDGGTMQGGRETSGARLAAVLRVSAPSGYCIDCLVVKLDVPVQELRDVAQVLVARPGFSVVPGPCYTCGSVKDVFVPRRPEG
jgi:hypothetical protein